MIIQLGNIEENHFSLAKQKFTSLHKADELSSCNAYPGDIIIAKMMPAGRACILPDRYKRYLLGSDAIRVKVDISKNDNEFVCAQINSARCKKWISERTGGSTRQRIGLPQLRDLPLFLPTLAEQRKLAAFLGTFERRISVQNKIIEEALSLENESTP